MAKAVEMERPARRARTLALRVASAPAPIEIPVRESKRARQLRIVVGETRNGEIELVVPPRTGEEEIDRFLGSQRGWIERTLREQRRQSSLLGLSQPGVVWRLGQPLPVLRRPGVAASARLGRAGDRLALGVSGTGAEAAGAVERWLREEARLVLETICAREAQALGVDYGRVRIGGQRSNWGSCSQTGTLSFNWRLILCPLEVVDYLAVHELCHRREMNHSKRFWELVSSRRAGYRDQERWLKRHGFEVRFWSPAQALGLRDSSGRR